MTTFTSISIFPRCSFTIPMNLYSRTSSRRSVLPMSGHPRTPLLLGTPRRPHHRPAKRRWISFARAAAITSPANFGAQLGAIRQPWTWKKKNPQLDHTTWRVLVDNLGMAYGITGDLSHAEDTFNYGRSKDPAYPMFYYNLACV